MAKTQGSLVNVLLALIGRGWLTATDRLDKAEDFVRIEIATALTQAKSVIPVLIDDVPKPAKYSTAVSPRCLGPTCSDPVSPREAMTVGA